MTKNTFDQNKIFSKHLDCKSLKGNIGFTKQITPTVFSNHI